MESIKFIPKENHINENVLLHFITEDAYNVGYADAMKKTRKKNRERREQQERKKYFIKQRLCGIALLVITAFAVRLLDGDISIAFFTIPLGICLLLSRQMLIINDYYWEHKDEL